MANDDDEELKELRIEFACEALEGLAAVEAALDAFDSPQNGDAVAVAFRHLHSVKGGAASLGMASLERLAHASESILAQVRISNEALSGQEKSALFVAVDVLAEILVQVRETSYEPAGSRGRVDEALAMLNADADHIRTRSPEVRERLEEQFTKELAQQLLDLRGRLDQIDLEGSAPKLTEDAFRAMHSLRVSCSMLGFNAAELIAQRIEDRLAGEASAYPAVDPAPLHEEFELLQAALVEQGLSFSSVPTPTLAATSTTPPDDDQDDSADAPASETSAEKSYVRVEVSRLDGLFNLVGELTARVAQVRDEQRTALARLSTALNQATLDLRLVPLERTFRRIRHVFRDTVREVEKDVELVIEGAETEVDRAIAELLADPLMHIVRNAVDHGIELPESRTAKGKPAAGKLVVRAYQQGGDIVVSIRDDGAGLDPAKLRAKALEKGLIDESADLSERECFELLFLPGFSTAANVTTISGRGVGMDVVRRHVESARGAVGVDSVLGEGTAFTISLPLTLATVDAMFVKVREQLFAIPVPTITGIVQLNEREVLRMFGTAPAVRIRDIVYPVLRIGHEVQHVEPSGTAILMTTRGLHGALVVDSVLSAAPTIVKPMGSYLGRLPCVAGCSITETGELALLIDPWGLLCQQRGGRGAEKQQLVGQESDAANLSEVGS